MAAVFCVQPVWCYGGCYGVSSTVQTVGLVLASVAAAVGVLTGLVLVRLLGGRRASSSFELLLPPLGLTILLASALDVLVYHSTDDDDDTAAGAFNQAAFLARLAAAADIVSIAFLLAYACVVGRRLLAAVLPSITTLILTTLATAAFATAVLLSSVNESSVIYRQKAGTVSAAFMNNAAAFQFVDITNAILAVWIGELGTLLLLCLLVVIKEPGELGDLATLAASILPMIVQAGLAFLLPSNGTVLARRALMTASFLGLCLGAMLRNRRTDEWAEIEDDEKGGGGAVKRPSPARLSSIQPVSGPRFTMGSLFAAPAFAPPAPAQEQQQRYYEGEELPRPPPLMVEVLDAPPARGSESTGWTSVAELEHDVIIADFPRPPTAEFPRPITLSGSRITVSRVSSRPPRGSESKTPSPDSPLAPPSRLTALVRDDHPSRMRDSVQSVDSVDVAVVRQASVAKRTPSQRVANPVARSPSFNSRNSRGPRPSLEGPHPSTSRPYLQPVQQQLAQTSDESLPDPALATPRASRVPTAPPSAYLSPRATMISPPTTGRSDESWKPEFEAGSAPVPVYRIAGLPDDVRPKRNRT